MDGKGQLVAGGDASLLKTRCCATQAVAYYLRGDYYNLKTDPTWENTYLTFWNYRGAIREARALQAPPLS